MCSIRAFKWRSVCKLNIHGFWFSGVHVQEKPCTNLSQHYCMYLKLVQASVWASMLVCYLMGFVWFLDYYIELWGCVSTLCVLHSVLKARVVCWVRPEWLNVARLMCAVWAVKNTSALCHHLPVSVLLKTLNGNPVNYLVFSSILCIFQWLGL